VTPRSIDPWLKISLGLVLFALFAVYVLLAGRRPDRAERTPAVPGS
jgi:hypothetical protein